MNFTLIDLGGLAAAVVVCGALLVLPGLALARLFRLDDGGRPDALLATTIGLALLPVLDSVAARLLGLDAALASNLALAGAGLLALRGRELSRPSRVGVILAAGWLGLVAVEWVDFDVLGRLYQPLTVFDLVKHAATTQAIADSGAPPRDAFFLRPDRSSYYYFFYTLPALAMRLSGGLFDAKAAVGGMVVWTGVGVFGLVRLTMARAGLALAAPRPLLVVIVLAAGGLDIVAVVFFAVTRHYLVADPLQWNEQAGAWFEDVIWVPHHVSALIAGTLGLIGLCDAMGEAEAPMPPRATAVRGVLLAGLCFASSLGLSVWVTVGFVATVAAWIAILLVERRWRAIALIGTAGALALVVALPQLLDLRAGRAAGGDFPIGVMVRPFAPVELLLPNDWWQAADLVALPLSYALEFGVLALGALVFWRRRRPGDGRGEFHRALTIAAIAGLVVGAFLRSTLFNNDLGWRVMLLPLVAATVWTIVVLDRLFAARVASPSRLQPAFATLAMLGCATTVYAAVMMRAYPFVTVNPAARFMAADPETERALRDAFGWARGHLSASAVLQQNPTFRRAFAFMYGRNPIGVADGFASLYGADPRAVAARLGALGPIFQGDLPPAEIGARASAAGIDDLVVTAADPVWSQPGSFVWRTRPIFAAPRVRIFPVGVLEAAR